MCSDCSHFVRLAAASSSSKKLRVCTSCHLGQQHEHYGSVSAMATPSSSNRQSDRHAAFRVSREQERAPASTATAAGSGSNALFNTADDTWFTDPQPELKDFKPAKSKFVDDVPSRVATWSDAHPLSRRSVSDEASRYHSQQIKGRPSQAAASISTSSKNAGAMESDSDDARYTEKKHFKGLFHSKAKAEKKQRKEEQRKKSGDQDKQQQAATATSAANAFARTNGVAFAPASTVQPSFYEADADALVVDDSPGYYDAVHGDQSSRQSKWQHEPVAVDHRSTSLMPSAVAPREISSGESYSIVERPADEGSFTAQPDSTEKKTSPANAPKAEESSGTGGITGALKRFLGFSKSKAAAAAPPPSSAPKQSQPAQPVALARQSSESSVKVTTTNMPRTGSNRELKSDRSLQRNQSWDRYTMIDNAGASRRFASQDSIHPLRSTVVGQYEAPTSSWNQEDSQQPTFAMPTTATATASSASRDRSRTKSRSKKKLKRRDTFDDLFESPKAVSRDNPEPAAAWGTIPSAQMPSTVPVSAGVSRFDQKRQEDEYRNDTSFDPLRSMASPRGGSSSYYAGSGAEPSAAKASTSSWGSVYSTPGAGTATYAVPVSLQHHTRDPRLSQPIDQMPDSQDLPEEIVPRSNIMDALAGGRTTKATKSGDSVDDIFAQFEQPSDYVFDERTGGYVQARDISKSKRVSTASSKPQRDHRAQPAPVEPTYEPVYSTYDRAVTESRTASIDAGDSEDDTIVDKISSLEGELAALKQLIRKRNGHGRSSSETKPASKSKAKPKKEVQPPRKESIFDHDSSDEEVKPKKKSNSKSAISTLRTKNTQQKKRRDSFADLFEDDNPAEKKNIVGGKSYESLFQTGAKEEEDDDEDDVEPTKQKPEYEQPSVLRNDLQDEDEEDFVSLKNRSTSSFRRAKSSAKRSSTTSTESNPWEANDDDTSAYSAAARVHKPSSTALSEDDETAAASRMVSAVEKTTSASAKAKTKPSKRDDHIDALFDDSNDRDVTAFFRDEKEQDQPQSDEKPEKVRHKKRSSSRKSKSRNASLRSNAIDSFAVVKEEGKLFTSADPAAPVAQVVPEFEIPTTTESAPDPDEEFSVNWKQIKSTRAKHAKRSSSTQEDIVTSSISLEDDVVQTTAISDPAELLGTEETMHTTTLDIGAFTEAIAQAEEPSLISSDDVETVLEEIASSGVTPKEELSAESHEVHFAPAEEVVHVETESKPLLAAATITEETPLAPLKSKSSSRRNTRPVDEDHSLAILDSSKDLNMFSSFGVGPNIHAEEDESDGEEVHHDEEPYEDAVSFEIKPKRRSSPAPVQPVFEPTRAAAVAQEDDTDGQVVMFGKYATQKLDRTGSNSTLLADLSTTLADANVEDIAPESSLEKVEETEFNADWQQMQEEAKARKKKLQMKQRQAQRDKLSSSKKKKDKDGDQKLLMGSSSSSANLLEEDGGKSRKKKDKKSKHKSHRKLAVEDTGDASAATTAPRSLTEL